MLILSVPSSFSNHSKCQHSFCHAVICIQSLFRWNVQQSVRNHIRKCNQHNSFLQILWLNDGDQFRKLIFFWHMLYFSVSNLYNFLHFPFIYSDWSFLIESHWHLKEYMFETTFTIQICCFVFCNENRPICVRLNIYIHERNVELMMTGKSCCRTTYKTCWYVFFQKTILVRTWFLFLYIILKLF